MKGGHKKPWTISLHNHTILIHHKQNYFIQHTMSDSFNKKTVAAPHTLVKIVSILKGVQGRVQLSSLRGLGSLVFEGALYLSARSNQGNTVIMIIIIINFINFFRRVCHSVLKRTLHHLYHWLPCVN